MPDRSLTPLEIARLKKRRDELLNRSCNRHERRELYERVRRINRILAGGVLPERHEKSLFRL